VLAKFETVCLDVGFKSVKRGRAPVPSADVFVDVNGIVYSTDYNGGSCVLEVES